MLQYEFSSLLYIIIRVNLQSVSLSGPPRSLPHVKACRWVEDRKTLEEQKPNGCSEVLLVDKEGCIMEGLINNFFVVTYPDLQSGRQRIMTAGSQDPSLEGIMAKRVLEAAKELNLDIETMAPNVKGRGAWCEAFMTNSIRGLQPISRIMCTQIREGLPVEFEFQLPGPFPGSITCELGERVPKLQQVTHLESYV